MFNKAYTYSLLQSGMLCVVADRVCLVGKQEQVGKHDLGRVSTTVRMLFLMADVNLIQKKLAKQMLFGLLSDVSFCWSDFNQILSYFVSI